MNKLRIYITALLLIVSFDIAKCQKVNITDTFHKISAQISDGNITAALFYFNSADKSFYNKNKEYLENLAKNDSLQYSLEVHSIKQNKNNATVVALETARFSKYGRTTTNIGFKTFQLELSGKQWKITSVEERTYLKANYVTITSEFEPSEKEMEAIAEVEFQIIEEGENSILFWLNRGLKINKIENEKGEPLRFNRKDLSVEIPWSETLSKGATIKLKFSYQGNFFNESKELNYSLVNISEQGIFANWTTEWYPKLNGTQTKAKARLNYTVPKEMSVASVGRLVNTAEHDGKSTYSYIVNTPMDYTFNANHFNHYSNEFNGVQINVYLINASPEKAKMYADRTTEMIKYTANLYGVLPCDSYTISEVPAEITMSLGGAGGQGLNFYPTNSLRDDKFEFPLIAHEMGHIWWGGLVDSDIYSGALISEGMAQVNAILCYRHFYGEDAMWNFINKGDELYPHSARSYFIQFNERNDFPIAVYDENKSREFNRMAYIKPHFIMAMLMNTIGYPSFESALKRIVSEYANKRLSIEGIKEIMENESGQDLDYFFNQWFYRAGAPEFELAHTITKTQDGRYKVEGTVNQLREIYKVNAEILIANCQNSIVEKITVGSAVQEFSFLVDFEPCAIVFDPQNKILKWSEQTKSLSLLGEGLELFYTGKKEEGINKLAGFVEQNPYDLTGHSILGSFYLREKKYDLAKEHLQFVINEHEIHGKLSIDVPHAYSLLGKLYDETNNKEMADYCYNKVLNMVNIEGTHREAKAYFEKNKSDK